METVGVVQQGFIVSSDSFCLTNLELLILYIITIGCAYVCTLAHSKVRRVALNCMHLVCTDMLRHT